MPDDRLYNLLPEYYRAADTAAGGVLRELLQVISAQVDVVQADLDQLYRNWFIETCQDWVVPYLGDLVGYQPLSTGEAAQSTTAEGQRLDKAVEGRADVGRTVATRLRKGTPAVLVELAADVARWPARAVEFRTLLAATQSVNHVRLDRGRTADLRNGDLLDDVGGPFDRLAHVAEIARASSARRAGRYDIPDLGLFVWRLGCYSITRAPAFCWDQSRNQYSFNILGIDAPLLTSPPELGRLTEPDEIDVPAWIRRRWFEANLDDYYGPQASLCIWRTTRRAAGPGHRHRPGRPDRLDLPGPARPGRRRPGPRPDRVPARQRPDRGRVGQLPLRLQRGHGRRRVPAGPPPDRRPPGLHGLHGRNRQDDDATIMAAVGRWRADKAADAAVQDAVIEVLDSGVYAETIDIALDEGDRLELRAAPGTRPVILLLDRYANRPDAMRVYGTGQPNGTAAASPAAAAEPPLPQVDPGTGCLELSQPPDAHLRPRRLPGDRAEPAGHRAGGPRHHPALHAGPRLVPGMRLHRAARRGTEHRADPHARQAGRRPLHHRLDPGDPGRGRRPDPDRRPRQHHRRHQHHPAGHQPARKAVTRTPPSGCGGARSSARSWSTSSRSATTPSSSGCCGWPAASRDARASAGSSRGRGRPSRYECQPDLVRQAISAAAAPQSTLAASQVSTDQDAETARVRPRFNSLSYGSPVYCQLAQDCAPEITSGADDESELGAFHDLFQPQRLANLSDRLQDFTPADMNAAVFIVT